MARESRTFGDFVRRIGIITAAVIGIITVSTMLATNALRIAQAPLVARMQKTERTLQLSMQFVSLNTRRLDALGVLLTTDTASAAHKQAEGELEELRRIRSSIVVPLEDDPR